MHRDGTRSSGARLASGSRAHRAFAVALGAEGGIERVEQLPALIVFVPLCPSIDKDLFGATGVADKDDLFLLDRS